MSFHVFLEEKVDCAIMEVGVGGEYDSTNVLPCPVVCGITSLGIDHTALLGDTIDKIAWHKAGIMKPNVPAITVPQPLLAMEVLEKRSKEIGSKLAILKCDDVDQMKAVKLGLAGKHQFTNAALANALCLEWMTTKDVLSNSDLKTGLEAARWPGRCQRLLLAASPHIDWCLDGAHTPESLQICADWFSDICLQDDRPIYLVFNCTHERQGTTLLPPIVAAFQKLNLAGVIFTTNDPFSDPTSSGDLVNKNTCSDPEHSVQKSLSTTWTKIMIESSGKSDIEPLIFGTVQETVKFLESRPQCRVLITGSLHLVGSALTVFGNAVE